MDVLSAQHQEIEAALLIGNWLAIAGRVLELFIGVILAFLLVKVLALCRKMQC